MSINYDNHIELNQPESQKLVSLIRDIVKQEMLLNESEQQKQIQNIVKNHIDDNHRDILIEVESHKQNLLNKVDNDGSFSQIICIIIGIILLTMVIIANIIFGVQISKQNTRIERVQIVSDGYNSKIFNNSVQIQSLWKTVRSNSSRVVEQKPNQMQTQSDNSLILNQYESQLGLIRNMILENKRQMNNDNMSMNSRLNYDLSKYRTKMYSTVMNPFVQLFEIESKQQSIGGLSKKIRLNVDSTVYVQYQTKYKNNSPIKLNLLSNKQIIKSEMIYERSPSLWQSISILTSFNLTKSQNEYVIRMTIDQDIDSQNHLKDGVLVITTQSI